MPKATEQIRKALVSYGKMLRNAYIPQKKKEEIKLTMKQLNAELKRLEKEEQLENARYKIAEKRSNIAKLQAANKKPQSGFMRWLNESPDYLGLERKSSQRIQQNKQRSGPKHSINNDNFGFGFNF